MDPGSQSYRSHAFPRIFELGAGGEAIFFLRYCAGEGEGLLAAGALGEGQEQQREMEKERELGLVSESSGKVLLQF